MVSFRSILAAAAMTVVAVAQVPIAFSSVPAVAVAGNTYNITWGGGDGTPVTLTLRKGNIQDLDTVGIIANKVTGDYFEWKVNTTLATESDYALQITQGLNGINYSGQFAIVGGTGTSSISYSGLTTSTANNTGTITTEGVTMSRTAASSMGTGTNMPRNTTFSSLTLSATPRSTIASGASATTTASQSTSAPTSNVGASMGSSAALVMGIFGAIMFLQ